MWRSKVSGFYIQLFELIDAGFLLSKSADGVIQFCIGYVTRMFHTENLENFCTFLISVEVVERLGFAEKRLSQLVL